MNYTNCTLISLFFLLLSCSKQDNHRICDTTNPLENISWLKEIKRNFEENPSVSQQQQIIAYQYKEQDVFKIIGSQQSSDEPILVYDCEQNIVCSLGGILNSHPCPDFAANAKNEVVLFEN